MTALASGYIRLMAQHVGLADHALHGRQHHDHLRLFEAAGRIAQAFASGKLPTTSKPPAVSPRPRVVRSDIAPPAKQMVVFTIFEFLSRAIPPVGLTQIIF